MPNDFSSLRKISCWPIIQKVRYICILIYVTVLKQLFNFYSFSELIFSLTVLSTTGYMEIFRLWWWFNNLQTELHVFRFTSKKNLSPFSIRILEFSMVLFNIWMTKYISFSNLIQFHSPLLSESLTISSFLQLLRCFTSPGLLIKNYFLGF